MYWSCQSLSQTVLNLPARKVKTSAERLAAHLPPTVTIQAESDEWRRRDGRRANPTTAASPAATHPPSANSEGDGNWNSGNGHGTSNSGSGGATPAAAALTGPRAEKTTTTGE